MFRPPTAGYEEAPMHETVEDWLVPKKSAINTIKAAADLELKHISAGDAVTIERGRNPHHQCVGLIHYEGESFLAVLHWHRGQWYAQTDTRKGRVTEDMTLIGVARAVIKDQLQ